MFKFVANMHGDETIGRQLMIYLAEYLVNNYGKVPAVTQLVDSTDIYLMPSMNPGKSIKTLNANYLILMLYLLSFADGFEKSLVR